MGDGRALDWKVITFAVLGCYAAPALLLGVVGGAFIQSDVEIPIQGWTALWLGLFWATHFLGLPLLAGYFTAKYANNRPQLHVLVVALIGITLGLSLSSGSLGPRVALSVAFLTMAALGAFLVLRGRRLK